MNYVNLSIEKYNELYEKSKLVEDLKETLGEDFNEKLKDFMEVIDSILNEESEEEE